MNTISLPGGLDMRFMRESDTTLKALYRSTRQDLQFIHNDPVRVSSFVDMQFLAQQQSYHENYLMRYWIIELNGASVGRVTIDFSDRLVHLIDFALIPEARGQGYGERCRIAAKSSSKHNPSFITKCRQRECRRNKTVPKSRIHL